jgi:hypothetical protein
MKKYFSKYAVVYILAGFSLLLAGCGTTQMNTRAFEEILLEDGYANRMLHYGNQLAAQGRLPEAHTAYCAAEGQAYTSTLRSMARIRRMYMEQVLAAYEQGAIPPEPPIKEPVEPPKEKTTAALGSDFKPKNPLEPEGNLPPFIGTYSDPKTKPELSSKNLADLKELFPPKATTK